MLDVAIARNLRDFRLDIAFAVSPGEILVLMGSNGSGKSTTLNIIAGLLHPDTGCIRLNGTTLCEPARGTDMPIENRRIGYVFQNAAVFPHLTVRDNIGFGLRARGTDPQEIRTRVDELLGAIHLGDLAMVKARNLSGGQKQRVALARALAIQPSLLMLDEPFTSLDTESTRSIKDLIRKFVNEMQIPCIVVTHRRTDSSDIGDRAFVLCSGRKEWEGLPGEMPEECLACQCV
ncbi:sulfate/molybdate ABC transporter ATP-binding protein [Methanoregula sp.]|uniref:sulfate/molybdate ABC transporter ATP-binding protein n=1 Tax=Methanoregula sp. TaxID=2052170 RepID=UPI003C781E10